MTRKITFLTLLFALCATFSRAQLDDLHYIPPMHSFGTIIDIGDHVLYISTPEVNPVNYTIEDGAGNLLQAGTVSNALPVTYSLVGTNTDFDVLEADLNTVLPDRGLIVTASDSVYANIRMRGGTAQAASITAKGRVAAGTDFRIFTAPLQASNDYRNHVVGLMATQNGTVVNIDLTGTGVTLHGANAPATTNVITLNMNAGDSYVFGAASLTDVDNLTGMIGRRITSNNPIVVNSGSWTGSMVGAGGQDIIIDQMAPASALGQEFVTVRGLGTNDQEATMVIANMNNTSIFINGSTTPIATINAGDYFAIDGTNYINGALYIETSSPAYVWQVILGSNSNATQGGIFVPSLSCFSPTGVDLIPDIEMIGNAVFTGGVNVVTLSGATVTVNGAPIGVAPVQVTGSIYEYYQVMGLTGNVSVQSTESCAVAFFGASGAIGYGGYFSGFSDVVLNLGTDGLLNPSGASFCLDSTALIDVNSDYSIQWLLDDIAIPGATSDTLIPTVAGYYSVEISSPGGLCTDTTNQVFVIDDLAPTASNPLPVDVQCIGDVPLPDINVVTDEADFCTTYPTVAFVSDVSNGQTCPEIITRTYSVTDNSGNSINVTQTITVNDDVPPTASNPVGVNVQCIGDVPLPDVTVVTDEADNCTLNPIVAFVSDASDGLTCPETISRTYSVTDDCGNSINVIQTIVVNDDVLPTASNPIAVTVQCIGDVPAPDVTVVTDEADNCTAAPTVAFVSDVSDGLTCPETITRTYSVTDDCGNSINVVQAIIVNDITNPTASNPLTLNVQCIGDVPAPNIAVVTDEADNCTAAPMVAFVSDLSDGLSCPETITRTYSVTDDCGNAITVAQLIIVNDDIVPTASNPLTVNVECIGDVPAPDVTVVTDEADNCTVAPIVAFVSDVSDGLTCPETITRTYSVTDDCGNSINVTQSIVVMDVTNPTASNPVDINVECIGDVPVPDVMVVTDEADNCTANPIVAFVSDVSDGLSCPETITRTYSVTDDCGNVITVAQSVIVNDVTNPTASNPVAVTVQCIGDVPAPDVTVVTDEADNCTAAPIVAFVSDVSDGLTCPETITRTYSVTDDCGNTINVAQTIIVNDITNPTASNPLTVNVQCIGDVPTPNIAVVTDEADNCTAAPMVAFVSDLSDGLSCPETITRTYSVTDDCGNAITVAQLIIVNDDIVPTASNPLTVNIECIGDVPAPDVTVVTDEADNCTVAPIVAFVSDVSDGLSCPETITRTYSVTDDCGNTINVTQSIVVMDVTNPTASNPVDINVECIGDVPVPDVMVVTDEVDNCTANPIVAFVSDVSDGLSCPETITRTYSVTDDCGNVITVTQSIIVNDVTNPTASNPIAVTVQCIGDVPAPDVTVVTDEADNCTVAPTVAFVSDVSDGLTCPETITRTYSVTDDCGNTINVAQTITVNDDTNPTASDPAALYVGCLSDVPAPDVTVVVDEADNCTAVPTVSFLDEQMTGQVCDDQHITRRYIVTDDCGNSITVVHDIYVAASYATIDAGADLEVCEGTVVTLTAANPSAANISWTAPVQDNVAFVPPVGLNTYTVTADVCQGQCVTTDDVDVLVHPNPVVSFSVDDPLGCIDHEVTFTNNSTEATGGVSYWTVGDGSEFMTDGNTSLWYTYTTPGLYDVTLEVVSQFGCSSILTYTDYVDVTPLPIADFSFSPENMSIEDNVVAFTNHSINAQSYQWYFEPLGGQSTEENPVIQVPYDPNQSQEVTLYAISYGGCQDTIVKTILTIDDPLFFIPNTFTPDGNEFNNTFKPVIAAGIDLTDYQLTIFNRWGEVLFESHDYEIGWDGFYGNVMVEDATYLWRLEFGTDRNDTRVIEVGHVNMIR